MTIQGLIDKVQEEKPNTFTNAKLISFINEIEADVAQELAEDFDEDYTEEDNMGTTLLAEKPYDRLYVSYLKAMIDYANEEYASYQLNRDQHMLDMADFQNWVVRTDQAPDHVFPSKFRNIF